MLLATLGVAVPVIVPPLPPFCLLFNSDGDPSAMKNSNLQFEPRNVENEGNRAINKER